MDVGDLVALSLVDLPPRRIVGLLGGRGGFLRESDGLERCLAWLDPPGAGSSAAHLRRRAADTLARAERCGQRPVAFGAVDYPPLLAEIPDPPIVLWVKGQSAVLAEPAVAIVGSRAASLYALRVAHELAAGLAAAGLLVVSGMARGCDGAAHRGALTGGGRTVAVLGSGIDVPYPAEHAGLAAEIAASGAVVAEFPPGTPPLPHHFPRRNRIVSGLCRGVVVVEAPARSGSLITAAFALEQGRDVLAVPGAITGERHRGCHALIRDGARLVESPADVLEELGLVGGRGPAQGNALSATPDPVLDCLDAVHPAALDDLAVRVEMPLPVLLGRLTALELEGRIARTPEGAYVRLG